MSKKVDYLVIGSGPAGHVSAIRASQLGLKTAIIEKDERMLGGVCLNEGCIPAKALYRLARNERGNARDLGELVAESREPVKKLAAGLVHLFKKHGIDVLYGGARFIGKKTLIATGSRPRALRDIPFDGKKVISTSEAVFLKKAPKNALIVGGGSIGVEFADFFSDVGSKVTIVEMASTLLPQFDGETARFIEGYLRQKGVDVATSSSVKKQETDKYDLVLVAVGREANTEGLGLKETGVRVDDNGFIETDGMMRTSNVDIFAAGDVTGPPMFAHVAAAEGKIAAEASSGRTPDALDYGNIPNVVYSGVPAASVGQTEEEIKRSGIGYKVGRQFFKSNGRALAEGGGEGFVKVIACGITKKILGAHIAGRRADEMIHELALARKTGMTTDDLAELVHAHPTFSETVGEAARAVFGKALYS